MLEAFKNLMEQDIVNGLYLISLKNMRNNNFTMKLLKSVKKI